MRSRHPTILLALHLIVGLWAPVTTAQSLPAARAAAAAAAPPAPATPSALDGDLFYQLLLGELNLRQGEPGAGYSLILDAARRTNDPALYRRAVEIAFSARAGDAALAAVRAWKQVEPRSLEANRYELQVLLALNRVGDTLGPLQVLLGAAGQADLESAILGIPRVFARVTDRGHATQVVARALGPYVENPSHGVLALTTLGRMHLAEGQRQRALELAEQAHQRQASSPAPGFLALELMSPALPGAEILVNRVLEKAEHFELRLTYARVLLDARRHAEAARQFSHLTRTRPEWAEAWLLLGTLHVQDDPAAAHAALERYVDLASAQPASAERTRGLAQAYVALAQIAQQRKDLAAAQSWLAKIEDKDAMNAARSRRASLLAASGRVDEALTLLSAAPGAEGADGEKERTVAKIALLREHKRHEQAYALAREANAKGEFDADLVYEEATLAERLGRFDEMERRLRELIARQPDYHAAYNALGYSLADRGQRLDEARALIVKALEHAPNDPFITDSLGWVEFRKGNLAEAQRLLELAFRTRPDAEIAAHLGEVFWSQGQREQALRIWRDGQRINPENETLIETLRRLGAKP